MNIYLNEKQKQALQQVLDCPGLVVENEELIQEIRMKLNKKKIDKNIVLPSIEIVDAYGFTLVVEPRGDNGALLLKARKEEFKKKKSWNGYFKFQWETSSFVELLNHFQEYVVFAGEDHYDVYDVAYSEELNIYKDEVERSVSISGNTLSYICYTGNPSDDHWTYLTPAKVKECLRLMLPELFSMQNVPIDTLHEDLQKHYIAFIQKEKVTR